MNDEGSQDLSDQTNPDQTNPDQTNPDQTNPDQTSPDQTIPDQPIKGRGSVSNPGSRYVALHSVLEDDGWAYPRNSGDENDDFAESKVGTQFFADKTVNLITQNNSPDIPFSQSINPYKGCEHGCIYCFARPTHAYLDLSPGMDFETKIFHKTNVQECLQTAFIKPSYQCSTLAIGTNTDPYQPGEKKLRVMREILEVLLAHKHPVSIVTKSALILRDIDLLEELAELNLVSVNISVTTLDVALKTKLEPRTAGPAARLRVITQLRAAGIPTGALLAPIIPFINDHEIEALVARCAEVGVQALAYILIRLPLEVAPLFEQWLYAHYPLKAKRVMAAIKQTRGGRAYRSQWHTRMTGEGPIAELIRARFNVALHKHALKDQSLTPLRTDLFTPSGPTQAPQLQLF